MANLLPKAAVRTKCRDLHSRLSIPEFQLHIYFLNPKLDLLSSVDKYL